jgi:uncharacterized protein YjiS (DUF1127 family)
MNPRHTQEQIGLFPATPTKAAAEVDALRAEAAAARDAAIAGLFTRAVKGIAQFFTAVGTALVTYPERRAAYDRLRTLTDRELADIGLTRGEIVRVFDPEFRVPARPANTNARPLPSGRPRVA